MQSDVTQLFDLTGSGPLLPDLVRVSDLPWRAVSDVRAPRWS